VLPVALPAASACQSPPPASCRLVNGCISTWVSKETKLAGNDALMVTGVPAVTWVPNFKNCTTDPVPNRPKLRISVDEFAGLPSTALPGLLTEVCPPSFTCWVVAYWRTCIVHCAYNLPAVKHRHISSIILHFNTDMFLSPATLLAITFGL
jgi:hypothetical protein